MNALAPRMALALLAAVASAIAAPATAAAQPVAFTLDVSPTSGGLEDVYVATVRIEVSGVSGPERYWHPSFDHFTVLETQTPLSSTTRTFSGGTSRMHTVELRRYVLKANRGGRLTVGPAKLRIAGKDYETRRVVIEVKGGSAPGADAPAPSGDADPTAAGSVGVPGFSAPDPAASREDMFLHVVADKRKVYVGDQVTVTWLLYTRSEVLRFEPRPPRLDRLWSETLFEPEAYFTYHDTRVGRVPYVVTIVSKRAIFPTSAGQIEIDPYSARVASLGTPLGRPRTLTSPPLTIEVMPLPDGAPPGFDPTYVGVFEVEAEVDRPEIDAAESLTLTLTVRAQGAIRRTRAPQLSFPGFEFREPRDFGEEVDTSGDLVRGERVYRYWTTPQTGGAQSIPAIEIPYFDPKSGRYEVARASAIPIVVRGDPAELTGDDLLSTRENLIARDIRLLRTGDTIATRTAPRLYRSRLFWALAASPPLAFLLVLTTDRMRQRLKKETPRARLRRARGRARQRFRVAEIHLRGNRPAKFFGELARVLYDHIEERTGETVQSMTREEMRQFLAGKGFADSTIKQIDHSLESFDYARFAPTAADQEEMRAALRRTRELLRSIEKTRLAEEEEEA